MSVVVLPYGSTTTRTVSDLFSRTTWVSQHQKGESFWVWMKQEMMGWQWHCLHNTTTLASHQSYFTGWMLCLMPNQQCQSTKSIYHNKAVTIIL